METTFRYHSYYEMFTLVMSGFSNALTSGNSHASVVTLLLGHHFFESNSSKMGSAASTSNDSTLNHIRATVLEGRPIDASDVNVSNYSNNFQESME